MFCVSLQATLKVVAAERDFAISEMKEMAEQCQGVAEEFQLLADQHDQLQKEIVQVRLCVYIIFVAYTQPADGLCVFIIFILILKWLCVCMQVRTERDRAIKACESAYEASELLKTQLSLVSRERDLAQTHVRMQICDCNGTSTSLLDSLLCFTFISHV